MAPINTSTQLTARLARLGVESVLLRCGDDITQVIRGQ